MRVPEQDEAEAIALRGLAFLAQTQETLGPFLEESGIAISDLAQSAMERDVQISVLDWLLGNESLLMVFAADSGIAPETILPARHVLAGDIAGR